ncbi:MAG: LysM peptidoglycan-binding domain-containing protein [Flavobacteriales bacterium]
MKKSLLILSFFLGGMHFFYAQKVYKVKPGDTLYNISKTHKVSVESLYEMNSGLKQNGLKEGGEIIISSNDKAPSERKLVYTKSPEVSKVTSSQYRVQKGDTLYGISKKLGIPMDTLVSLNNGLTSENLKVDQILNTVKVNSTGYVSPTNNTSSVNTKNYYTVLKGDTLYTLAKRFNTDEATLKTYNPILVNGLRSGQKIYFPAVENGFILHKVKKGETIFSIVRRYNISLDTLLQHNPDLKAGLKAGMKLKIPVKSIIEVDKNQDIKEEDDLLNVVYILPFNSTDYKQSKKRSFMTTEFYMGSLFALDSLANQGQKIKVKTFDNKATLEETKAVAEKINFEEVDLIIGPLRSDNVHWMADHIKSKKIKMISLFSKSVNVTGRENLIKANLTQDALIEGLSKKIRSENQWDSIFVIGNDSPDLRVGLEKQFTASYIEQIT